MSMLPLPRAALSAALAILAATPVREAPAPRGSHQPPTVAPGVPVVRYAWPVEGPVIRGFEPPAGPFSAGHRGIDIGAPVGTTVRAAEAGRVAFAGTIAGERFVSIDHEGGVRTTYSWLTAISVSRGERVGRRAPIGTTGVGHGGDAPNLHFGARIAGVYVDPMLLLERRTIVGLIHLAPLDEEGERRL